MAPINSLQRIIANASWLTGARIIGDLANLALFVALARRFGPAGIGEYAYSLGIAGLVFAGVSLGLGEYAIRECSRLSKTDQGLLVGRMLILQCFGLSAALLLLWIFLKNVNQTPQGSALVYILATQQVFIALGKTLFSPAFGQQKMFGPVAVELSTRILGIIGAFAIIIFSNADMAMTLTPLAVASFMMLVMAVHSCLSESNNIRFSSNWIQFRQLIGDVAPFAASLLLTFVTLRSSFIIMKVMLGEETTGVYASGIKLMEAAVMPLSFIGLAVYPRLSQLYRSGHDQFVDAGDKVLRVSALIGVLISWFLFFFGPDIMLFLLGARFHGSESIVRSLAGCGFLFSISTLLVRFLLASDQQYKRLIIQTAETVVQVSTTIIAIWFFSIYGAVVGLYAAVLISIVLSLTVMHDRLRHQLRKSLVHIIFAIGMAVIFCLTVNALLSSMIWSAGVSITVFLGMIYWLRFLPSSMLLAFQSTKS